MAKKKNGRPLKYTDAVIEKHGENLVKFMKEEDNFWLKDYCIKNEFPSQCLSEWEKINVRFSEAYKKAKDIQESKLVAMGFSKEYRGNVAFIIFTLRNVARWKNEDQSEDVSILPDKITIKLPDSWK